MVFKAVMDVLGAWQILAQCDSMLNSGDLTRKTGRARPVKKKLLRTWGINLMFIGPCIIAIVEE